MAVALLEETPLIAEEASTHRLHFSVSRLCFHTSSNRFVIIILTTIWSTAPKAIVKRVPKKSHR